jgi:hypothetical protein
MLADFTAARRAALCALLERGRAAGDYRLLVGHAPLDEKAAWSLAAELTRSAG